MGVEESPQRQEDPASVVATAITKGKFQRAYRIAEYIAGSLPKEMLNAHFWFQYALAALLSRHDAKALELTNIAKESEGYSRQMYGDFLRDAALNRLRRGFDHVDHYLDLASYYVDDDPNRKAALAMARGRYALATGDAQRAWNLHNIADEMWDRLGNRADKQWARNNRFHWFKAYVALGKNEYNRNWALREALEDEPRFDRRLRLRLMHLFGRVYLPIDRFIERVR